jgi:hypothetical protein
VAVAVADRSLRPRPRPRPRLRPRSRLTRHWSWNSFRRLRRRRARSIGLAGPRRARSARAAHLPCAAAGRAPVGEARRGRLARGIRRRADVARAARLALAATARARVGVPARRDLAEFASRTTAHRTGRGTTAGLARAAAPNAVVAAAGLTGRIAFCAPVVGAALLIEATAGVTAAGHAHRRSASVARRPRRHTAGNPAHGHATATVVA